MLHDEKYDQPLTSAPRHNTIQNRSGVDHTSTMLDELCFTQLHKKHLTLVCDAYQARSGSEPDRKWGIRELTKNLKVVIIEGQKKLIVQRTGCTIESIQENAPELNYLTFRSLLRLRADYEEWRSFLFYFSLRGATNFTSLCATSIMGDLVANLIENGE